MTIAVRIRTWLESQREGEAFRACSLSGISEGLGEPGDAQKRKRFRLELGWSIAQQVSCGNVSSQPMHAKKYLYTFVRHSSRKKMDPEVRRQRKNERARQRSALNKKGRGRTKEEYLAFVREQAAANAANRAMREREYAIKVAARKRERRAAMRAAAGLPPRQPARRHPKPILVPASPLSPAFKAQAPKVERIETVDEFLARGGKVQQLPVGAVSQPLRVFTPQEQSEMTWRNRQAKRAA